MPISFFKKGVQEMMIARPDDAKNFVVWKHPDETVPFGSQLTVDSDEVAVFFRDGKIHGILSPGRHALESYNIPFLSNLIDRYTGGNLFKAEVFFVLTREIPSIKFGGKIGAVEDPKSGVPVVTMVHGTFSIRVFAPGKLIIGLVGMRLADNEGFLGWFREQTLKVIRDRIGELFVKKRWPLLDVTSGAYTEEIESDLIKGVNPYLTPYGVNVVKTGNFVISISDDDRENLKKLYTDAAYVRMAGGIQNFQQFAGGKALMGAGEGMAAGGGGEGEGAGAVMGGAGLGVGFGLAHMLARQTTQSPPQQYSGGQPPPSAPQGPTAAGNPQPSTPYQAAVPLVACPNCGKQVSSGKFCSECGKPLRAEKKFCPQCGMEVSTTAKFCPNCGSKIS